MKEETLFNLGLSKNEARVYLSLLRSGASKVTQIAEESNIHRVNIYDALKKLREKNLISELEKDGKKTFQASPPHTLFHILKEKEIQLQGVIAQLELDHSLSQNRSDVQIYEGYDSIRNMFIRFLEKKEAILDLGIPKFVLEQMGKHGLSGEFFHNEIHKRRIEQKQWMYHIYNSDAKERIKFLNTLPCTEGRYLPPEFDQLVTTTICGDELIFQVYYENGQKPYSIAIKNQFIADAYKKYFWLIWEKGIKE